MFLFLQCILSHRNANRGHARILLGYLLTWLLVYCKLMNNDKIKNNKKIINGNLQWHFYEVALHPLFPDRVRI